MTKKEWKNIFLNWTIVNCPSWRDRLNAEPMWSGDTIYFFNAMEPDNYVRAAFSGDDTPEGAWYWKIRSHMWILERIDIRREQVQRELDAIRSLQALCDKAMGNKKP